VSLERFHHSLAVDTVWWAVACDGPVVGGTSAADMMVMCFIGPAIKRAYG
jgi:hypothetical protein